MCIWFVFHISYQFGLNTSQIQMLNALVVSNLHPSLIYYNAYYTRVMLELFKTAGRDSRCDSAQRTAVATILDPSIHCCLVARSSPFCRELLVPSLLLGYDCGGGGSSIVLGGPSVANRTRLLSAMDSMCH